MRTLRTQAGRQLGRRSPGRCAQALSHGCRAPDWPTARPTTVHKQVAAREASTNASANRCELTFRARRLAVRTLSGTASRTTQRQARDRARADGEGQPKGARHDHRNVRLHHLPGLRPHQHRPRRRTARLHPDLSRHGQRRRRRRHRRLDLRRLSRPDRRTPRLASPADPGDRGRHRPRRRHRRRPPAAPRAPDSRRTHDPRRPARPARAPHHRHLVRPGHDRRLRESLTAHSATRTLAARAAPSPRPPAPPRDRSRPTDRRCCRNPVIRPGRPPPVPPTLNEYLRPARRHHLPGSETDMTTTTPADRRSGDVAADPAPAAGRRIPLALVVAGSMLSGLVNTLLLVLVVFAGATEPVITGAGLVGLASSWALLAMLTTRWTSQPQRWAAVPAAVMAVTGVALLTVTPDNGTLTA